MIVQFVRTFSGGGAGVRGAIIAVLLGLALLMACSTGGGSADSGDDAGGQGAADAEVSASVKNGATDVPVDTIVRTAVENGRFDNVELITEGGDEAKSVSGQISGNTWVASGLLEPGQTYVLRGTALNPEDEPEQFKRTFTTRALTLDQQTYASVMPLNGETVGVGMPVIVQFDIPVQKKQRALFERKMHVKSKPSVEGSWNWLNEREAHWRPKEYWPAGTKVTVDLRLNGLPAGNGIYGQKDQKVKFTVGKSVVSTVDVRSHKMQVKINGKLAKTLPVTTGDASHQSRDGVKLVMAKLPTVDMDAASTGVDADAPDYYNIKGVKWALRLTNSGEFIHAAPWSVGSHGNANVSHGCTGLSTSRANWFYHISHRGDPIKYINSSRQPEPGNGWTDWNVSWDEWQKGSALHKLGA